MPRISLDYQPTERQRAFHQSPAKYRLYGGAAGGGKSEAILMEAFAQALQYPGLDVLLLRKTFPELEKSLIQRMRTKIPKELYEYNEGKKIATLINGSHIYFGHLENKKDVYQYQGAEFGAIGWDELTHFTLDEWVYLSSRNRSPIKGHRSNMFAATNPGGIGHSWVKSLWIDQEPAPGMAARSFKPADYSFTPAKVTDNPFLMENDPDYKEKLEDLPDALRAALLDGSWDIFAGQYFDNFSPDRHIVKAPVPSQHWPKWISIDWGFAHDCILLYWTHDGTKYVTYREQAVHGRTGRQLGDLIVSTIRPKGDAPAENIEAIYLSHDAFAAKTDEHTVAQQLGDVLAFNNLPRPIRADTDRIGGWQMMWDLFAQDKWVIDRSCVKLIKQLPLMLRDEDDLEDCVKMNGDDAADAARYGIKTRVREVGVPRDVQIAEKLKHIPMTDLTSRMIAFISAEAQVREASRPHKMAHYGRIAA